MKDPSRIDRIVERLRAAWKVSPDIRLGQLVENVASLAQLSDRIWVVEDDEWEAALGRWAKGQAGKHVEGTVPT